GGSPEAWCLSILPVYAGRRKAATHFTSGAPGNECFWATANCSSSVSPGESVGCRNTGAATRCPGISRLCIYAVTRTEEKPRRGSGRDRKSTRLNSSHQIISYAVFCLK